MEKITRTTNVSTLLYKEGDGDNNIRAHMQYLIMGKTLCTEVGRLIRDTVPDPVERADLYWKLIEALDYKHSWHKRKHDRSLKNLLLEMKKGYWQDDTDDEEVVQDEELN